MTLFQAPTFDPTEILAAAADRIAQLDEKLQGLRGVNPRLEEWLRSKKAWRRARALMRDEGVEDFSGSWRIQEKYDMERFLER